MFNEALTQFSDLDFEGPDPLFEVRLRGWRLSHEPAHSVGGFGLPEFLKLGVCAADGHHGYPVAFGQGASGGEQVPWGEFPGGDLSLQVIEYAEIGLTRCLSVCHGNSVHMRNS